MTNQCVWIFHPPEKHPANPLLHGPARGGYVFVLREPDGTFRMYYQASDQDGQPKTGTGYAESDDGLNWTVPEPGLHEFRGTKQNKIVWLGSRVRAAGTQILELPERDRRLRV